MIDPVYNVIALHHNRLEILENYYTLNDVLKSVKELPIEDTIIGIQKTSYDEEIIKLKLK